MLALGSSGGSPDVAWLTAYLAFGVCLGLALRARERSWRLAFTLAQTALALVLLRLGMPHFQGALFAVVAAQTGRVVRPRVAWPWMLAQGIPLFITVLPSHEWLGATKATLEYAAFSAFAMIMFELRERERNHRLALVAVHAELLGTRALLRESAAAAVQNRIQRELHDGLGHHLTKLSVCLDEATRTGSKESLAQARLALDALRSDSREAVAGMRGNIALGKALDALTGAIPGMHVALDIGPLTDVGHDAAWAIFRFVQEAITNAHTHGRAKTVNVRARRDDETWELRIDDDGRGASPPVVFGGGLRGMKERLESVGASFVVETSPAFALVARFPRPALGESAGP